MENVTLGVALAASALALWLSPIRGLIVYLAVLAWYPSYLTVKMGTIDFSACRIVILAVYANIFLRTALVKQFKLIWLDKLVVLYFVCQILAGSTTTPIMMLIENRAGAVFDMVLPYFAIRITVTNKEAYLSLLKGILLIGAPLAIVGLYECLTGHNVFGFLHKYHAWRPGREYLATARRGFFRAEGTFNVSIMLGLFFAILGPPCAGLWRNIKEHKTLVYLGIGLMGVGVFSSMSSGPMMAALLAIGFIAFYRYKKYWKIAATTIVLMCGIVEIISNRHFYDVLGGFTLNPRTAWYRSKLINVALFEGGMSGHWLTGYGFFDPRWCDIIDGRDHTDVVNHYIRVLCNYGLVGLLPFIAIIASVLRNIINAYKKSVSEADRWLIWCLSATLFGIFPAMVTASLNGQPRTVFYMILACCGAMPIIMQKESYNLLLDPNTLGISERLCPCL